VVILHKLVTSLEPRALGRPETIERIVGAIGVSGGAVEQDVACASAGGAEWERALAVRAGGSA